MFVQFGSLSEVRCQIADFLHIYISSLLHPNLQPLRGQFHQATEETDGAVLSESLSCKCNA